MSHEFGHGGYHHVESSGYPREITRATVADHTSGSSSDAKQTRLRPAFLATFLAWFARLMASNSVTSRVPSINSTKCPGPGPGERPRRVVAISDFAPSLVGLTVRGTATPSRPVWGRGAQAANFSVRWPGAAASVAGASARARRWRGLGRSRRARWRFRPASSSRDNAGKP
jgi:hypothetical protein